MRAPDKGVLLITHYQRLLDYVRPDRVHVLPAGGSSRTGGPELAHELESEGYEEVGGVMTAPPDPQGRGVSLRRHRRLASVWSALATPRTDRHCCAAKAAANLVAGRRATCRFGASQMTVGAGASARIFALNTAADLRPHRA